MYNVVFDCGYIFNFTEKSKFSKRTFLFIRSSIISFLLIVFFSTQTIGQTLDDYRTKQSGNWNALTTWERYNGTTWQTLTGTAPLTLPTSGDNNITIRSSHTITVTANVTVDQVLIESGGQVTINSGRTLTIADGTDTDFSVSGTLQTNSTSGTSGITTTGNLVFNDGGTYVHNVNGEAVPIATWDTNSNCNIIGVTSTIPTVARFNQSFGNFTWNCAGQSATLDFNGNLRTINGDFTITSTNGQQLRLASGETQTLDVSGNFEMLNGTLNFNSGSGTFTMNVDGDFNHSGGIITESSSGNGAIYFNGTYNGNTGIQTFTSGGTISNNINFTVNNGAYLQMADAGTTITGNSFTLSSGATLGITSTDGISSAGATGNIQVSGTRTFSTGANYIYNGTSAQNTGNGLPATISNLIFDNSGGVITFYSAKTITNNFSINSGSLADLGTFTHSSSDLTLGGEGTASGSWGHPNSSAVNKNSDYFADNTGIINVSINSCSAPAAPANVTPSGGVEICSGNGTNLNATSAGNTINWYTTPTGGTSIGSSASGADFNVAPASTTTYYAETQTPFGCVSATRTPTATITVNSRISENYINVPNSNPTTVCATTNENTNLVVSAPSGTVFVGVEFASYGTPNGSCESFTIGACHAATSLSVCEGYLLGNNNATIPATNPVFTDPCVGTFKRLYVQALYNSTQYEICEGSLVGTITGSVPSGGNGTYTYLWESSTTSPSSDFVPAAGPNDEVDYDPGTLTQTTWFRRKVTSGGCSSTSVVVEITVNPAISITNLGAQIACDNYNLPSISGSNLSGNQKYYNNSQALGGTVITGPVTSTQTVWIYDTDGVCSDEESFTITIISRPIIDAVASIPALCAGGIVNPSTPAITANGSMVSSEGWQIETTSGSGIYGSLTLPYTVTSADNGKTIRYFAVNSCGTGYSNEVTLSVIELPTFTAQPSALTLCEGESGNFTVETSSSSPSYQWQYSNSPSGPWINTNGAADVSGHTTNQLSITNVPISYDNFYVSCIITSNTCSIRSVAVLLTVNPVPVTGEIIPD